jgi:oligopeptide/dipeptide ABC transporter ATP-binding protein
MQGRKIEEAPTAELFDRPAHPYTRGLMASIPRLKAKNRKRRLAEIPGIVPSLREPIEGCAFAPRCAYAVERCRVETPELRAGRLALTWSRATRPNACSRRRSPHESGGRSRRTEEAFSAAARPVGALGRLDQGRSTASASRSIRARRCAWSASPAAASRRSASCCCA